MSCCVRTCVRLLGAVVAEVDEDDYIALLDSAVDGLVVDRLDKLVGNAVGIALLYGLDHIGGLLALSVDQQVVSLLDAVPALVAVHSVETADDAGNVCAVSFAHLARVFDKACAALGVGVTAIHEAVYVSVAQSVLFRNLDELEEMIERRVNAAGRSEAHRCSFLPVSLA